MRMFFGEVALFHAGVFDEVKGSLAKQRADFVCGMRADDAAQLPAALFYHADAAGLREVLVQRALNAEHAGCGAMRADIDAGLALLAAFLAGRMARATDPLQRFFCAEVTANLDPEAAGPDRFVMRLHAGTAGALPGTGYRLLLSCAGMDVRDDATAAGGALRLARAIYDRQQQQSLLEHWYDTCEDTYIDAVNWFGKERRESFLALCWDNFRQVAIDLVMLFRDSARAAEQEWVATLLGDRADSEGKMQYGVRDNAVVPYIRVPLPDAGGHDGLCLKHILADHAQTGSAAAQGLRALLRHHGLFHVGVAAS